MSSRRTHVFLVSGLDRGPPLVFGRVEDAVQVVLERATVYIDGEYRKPSHHEVWKQLRETKRALAYFPTEAGGRASPMLELRRVAVL